MLVSLIAGPNGVRNELDWTSLPAVAAKLGCEASEIDADSPNACLLPGALWERDLLLSSDSALDVISAVLFRLRERLEGLPSELDVEERFTVLDLNALQRFTTSSLIGWMKTGWSSDLKTGNSDHLWV